MRCNRSGSPPRRFAFTGRHPSDCASAEVLTTTAERVTRLDIDTAADVEFGFLALAYAPSQEWERFLAALTTDSPDTGLLSALSDNLWNRTDEFDISPAYLAYLSEVCSAYVEWNNVKEPDDAIGHALWSLHRPCAGWEHISAAVARDAPPKVSCIGFSRKDPVSSDAVAEQWIIYANPLSKVVTDEPGHDGTQALAECLAVVG